MYKIIYMKADYEPWWQFEGWESTIVTEYHFQTEQAFQQGLKDILTEFRSKYNHEKCKEGKYYAFWSEDETYYCEACDDESQIYHGIIVEHDAYNNRDRSKT